MIIDEILKFKEINKLKEVYRFASVGEVKGNIKRNENSAEHTWSSLMVANYFYTYYDFSHIDKLKVYDLLLFHDLVEIESGDVVISPNSNVKDFDFRERSAAKILKDKLPKRFGDNFYELFLEFQNQSTVEARFARAIEQLDAEIHELDYKEDYKGFLKSMEVKSPIGPLKKVYYLTEAGEKIVKFKVNKNFTEQVNFIENFLIELSTIYIHSLLKEKASELKTNEKIKDVQILLKNTFDNIINSLPSRFNRKNRCPDCNAEIQRSEASFCAYCGAILKPEVQEDKLL